MMRKRYQGVLRFVEHGSRVTDHFDVSVNL